MVIATRADVDTRSIVRLPDADTSKKGYKFTDPDGEFPRVVPLPVQGDVFIYCISSTNDPTKGANVISPHHNLFSSEFLNIP